ncbi:MAG: redoxin domain-containing protein [Balneolia bacterium]|nr:redoxin domain-containing protein [Balneolia bacterium]
MKSISTLISFCVLLLGVSFLTNGEAQAQSSSAEISGMITVDHTLDSTGDYSGIGVAIVHFDQFNSQLDTLFYAVTDVNGMFSGTASFRERNEYVISITRNQRLISTSTVVLADGDAVEMRGEIPGFSETFRAESVENSAVNDFRRVERNFGRVVDFINAGYTEVSQDTIPILMRTWSDLFWSIQDTHPNTLAAETGTLRSIEVIQGWDDELVLQRARQGLREMSEFKADRATIAADAITRLNGVDRGIAFIDSIRTLDISEDDHILLEMRKIELLTEHDDNERALRYLNDFRLKYADDRTLNQWSEIYLYDIQNLAKGMPMPEFELLLQDERRVTNSDFEGKYLLLEVANLASGRYITEHTLLSFLYEDINDEVQFLTVPTTESPVTIQAFYEERPTPWPVAKSRQVHSAGLMDLLNVVVQPTRVLVAPDGTIIRKYSGTDLSVIENDIRTLLNEDPS